jgi:CheY-like chemotaxis protein
VGATLRESGYTNLRFFENGADAWDWISSPLKTGGRVEDVCDLLISDVEMPQVDGFHLTKRIKEHPDLKRLPVMLYSSIVTPDNRKKGAAVGANAQISKPELGRVVQLADELISAAWQQQSPSAKSVAVPTVDGEPSDVAAAGTPASGAAPAPTLAKAPATSKEPVAKPFEDKPASKRPSQEIAQEAAKEAKPQPAPVAHATAAAPPTPRGVDLHIWQTFHRELQDRVAKLQSLIAQAESNPPTAELINELFRTLHTIKSAAMVVPVESVTRTTHLIEGLLEASRSDPSLWPQGSLRRYLAWLEELTSARGTQDNVLARAADLELALTETLAAAIA